MESDESDIGEMLDDLLANSEPDSLSPEKPKKSLRELNFNFLDSQANMPQSSQANRLKDDGTSSLVHEPEVDSSDDEDKRNFESQKYSETGRDLKNLLKNESSSQNRFSAGFSKMAGNLNFSNSPKLSKTENSMVRDTKNDCGSVNATNFGNSSIFTKVERSLNNENSSIDAAKSTRDPIFGINLVKPQISSAELVERMRGRHPVTISKVRNYVKFENINNDWVIAGVLISRSTTKTSQKGSQYCIWKLSDLSDKMSTISIFLFSGAYKLFWKTTTGSVVGILNPNVMDSKDDIDEATLSVDNAQKLMIFGDSRDMAKCKSTKKNGDPCSNVVNLSRCEYCVYHVKLEYNKASRRSDIQSNASGKGFSSSLPKNKKIPLSGIYAQQETNFVPVYAKRNEKLFAKDSARLALLQSGNNCASPRIDKTEGITKKAFAVELTTNQVKKDLEKLNKLRGWNSAKEMSFATPLETSKFSRCTQFLEKEEARLNNESNSSEKTNSESRKLIKSTVKNIKSSSEMKKINLSFEFMEKSIESSHKEIKSSPIPEKFNLPEKSIKSTEKSNQSSPTITKTNYSSKIMEKLNKSAPTTEKSIKSTEKSDQSSPTPTRTNYSSKIMEKLIKSSPTIEKSNNSKKLPRKTVKSTHEANKSSPVQEKTNHSSEIIKSSPKSSLTLQKTNSSPKLSEKSVKSNTTLKKSNSSPKPEKPEKSISIIEKTICPPSLSVPRLGVGAKGGRIDFSQPITKQQVNTVRLNAARLNASRWIKQNCGPLKESNPNKIRESKTKIQESGEKRRREAEEANEEIERKVKKTAINDKFKELMEAKSSHVDLIDKSIENDQEKYFEKLEIKERMEEKMLTTFKIDCKAVKCIICKYTSFSASDLCKERKHPLRIIDATKSFFKCNDCGNRTVSLDRIPNHSCKKCSGSNWIRAAMMSDKKTDIPGAKLSIRGGEETFIGSVVQDANLNLLVPDSGTGS